MLARCAGKDKYFPMIETLFAQQKDWVVQKPLQPMFAIAKQAGFTQQTFDAVPGESADAQRHRRGPDAGDNQVQRQLHARPSSSTARSSAAPSRSRSWTSRSPPISRADKGFFPSCGRPAGSGDAPRRADPLRSRRDNFFFLLRNRTRRFILSRRCGNPRPTARPTPWARALNDSFRVNPLLLLLGRHEAHAAAPARLQILRRSRPIS